MTLPFSLTLRGRVGLLIGFLSILLFQGIRRHILSPLGGEMENLLVSGQSEGFPGSASNKRTRLPVQETRDVSDPWVGKIPWRRAQQPTPVLLPGEPTDRGAWQATVHGVPKSWT